VIRQGCLGSIGVQIHPDETKKQKTSRKYLRNGHRARILSATLGESTIFHHYKTRTKVQNLNFCNTPRVKMHILQHVEKPERELRLE